jgi:pyruvate/2-oxoglutarate dehydrogenase complex dihydrolipoamide dehydrogenase (E3) component
MPEGGSQAAMSEETTEPGETGQPGTTEQSGETGQPGTTDQPGETADQDVWDVVVIGGGAVGENLAQRLVKRGLRAILVESELLGGECSYWACMPSKALLRSGEALRAARAVPGAAEAVTGQLDVPAVLERRDGFTSHWDDSSQMEWAENASITVLRGSARLDGTKRVVVQPTEDSPPRVLEARHAVGVCVGSRAAMPPIPGLREARPWTSREATSAKEAPKRLAILGGGVVGCEMAQAWSDLGSHVTLLEMADRLLPGFEAFAGEHVAEALRAAGVEVRTSTTVRSVSRDDDGPVVLSTDGDDVSADAFLVATGRETNTATP